MAWMKSLLLSFLFLVLIGESITLFVMKRESSRKKILAVMTTSSVTPTPSITPSPKPTPSPSPAPTLVPTPKPLATPKPTAKAGTPVPQPKFSSQQINEFIDRFAGQYGVDPNVIRHIAICESGFNPSARNYIYTGLFQFGPITWQNIRVKMNEDDNINLRLNAEDAVQTAAYAISIGDKAIWPHCYP